MVSAVSQLDLRAHEPEQGLRWRWCRRLSHRTHHLPVCMRTLSQRSHTIRHLQRNLTALAVAEHEWHAVGTGGIRFLGVSTAATGRAILPDQAHVVVRIRERPDSELGPVDVAQKGLHVLRRSQDGLEWERGITLTVVVQRWTGSNEHACQGQLLLKRVCRQAHDQLGGVSPILGLPDRIPYSTAAGLEGTLSDRESSQRVRV